MRAGLVHLAKLVEQLLAGLHQQVRPVRRGPVDRLEMPQAQPLELRLGEPGQRLLRPLPPAAGDTSSRGHAIEALQLQPGDRNGVQLIGALLHDDRARPGVAGAGSTSDGLSPSGSSLASRPPGVGPGSLATVIGAVAIDDLRVEKDLEGHPLDGLIGVKRFERRARSARLVSSASLPTRA